MSILSTIAKPKDRPVVATITGYAGSGKTSLAATFPKPLFIRAEDGLQSIPAKDRPDAFPVLKSVDDLWEQLKTLINEDHGYETLVIDSVTALEEMFMEDVVSNDPKKPKSLAQALGGYGAGFTCVGAMHHRVRKAAGILNEQGMNIVFIAHSDIITIELPDSDPYTRYELKMNKRGTSAYVDNVDLVGFLKLEIYTKDDKAITDGTRVLTSYTTASCISKNRYGITEDLEVSLGKNPLAQYIPTLKGK